MSPLMQCHKNDPLSSLYVMPKSKVEYVCVRVSMYQGKMDSRVTPSLDEPECLGHCGVWWVLENEGRGEIRK